MKTLQQLRNQLWALDKNGYLTLSDDELNDRGVLEAAINYILCES